MSTVKPRTISRDSRERKVRSPKPRKSPCCRARHETNDAPYSMANGNVPCVIDLSDLIDDIFEDVTRVMHKLMSSQRNKPGFLKPFFKRLFEIRQAAYEKLECTSEGRPLPSR